MESKRRTRIKIYFLNKAGQDASQKLGAVAAVVLLSGVALLFQGIIDFALGLLLLGVLLAAAPLARRAMRPADADLDSWLEDGLKDLLDRALDRCNVVSTDQVRDPVTVIGPVIEEIEGSEFRWRKGKDGQIRFNPMKVAIIIFLEYQIAVYQCAFDLISGKHWNEGADIIQYRHVVSISTMAKDISYSLKDLDRELLRRNPDLAKNAVDGKVLLKCAECFVLATSAGGFLTVYLQDPLLFKGASGKSPILERAREAVRSIQARLREVAASERTASI